MHTADELTADTFEIHLDGEPATLRDVLPELHRHDRLGLIVDRPLGGFGASTLVLAAVTGFYDAHRERSDDFFIYPDHYVFHVGERHADHSMLDLWPDHKEVLVAPDAEELLRAINDRAITRLLLPDVPPAPLEDAFERQTLASARDRLRTAVAYSPSGRVTGGRLRVRGSEVTESYVETSIDRSDLPDGVAAQWRRERDAVLVDGVPVESYEPISVDDALGRLVAIAGTVG